jgi:hypothetical protein
MGHGLMIKLLKPLNHLVLKNKIDSMVLYLHEVTHDHITNK